MKQSHLFYAVAVGVFLTACADDPSSLRQAPQLSVAESATNTYLVRFKSSIPSSFGAQVAALGGEVIFAHQGVGIAAVAGLSASGASSIAASSGVAAVDGDAEVLLETAAGGVEAADATESPAAPATALRYNRQWNMHTIQAAQAWAAGNLGAGVKVGVLDTGIDYLHPDLFGRVDLTLSKSFLNATENARVQAEFPGAHPVADLNYHGTHVSATVASNAYIYAGVTSQVTLVGLKVCSPGTAANGFTGSCPTSGVLAAVLYAADNNLPVINMSLGGNFNRRDASAEGGVGPSFLATINQVFAYANRKGTTVVVSAGNSAIDLDHDGNGYKTYCSAPHVICVSATGPTSQASLTGPWANINALASYSNFGRSAVSVAAPGGNGVSVSAACSGFTIHTSLLVCRNRFYTSPTSWSAFSVGVSGTSMASPHVAGLAALAVANGASNPAQVRAAIESGADDLGQSGTDPAYGKGRINVARTTGAL